MLCATGYCDTSKGSVGQGYNPTYSGTCSAGGPSIDTVYMQNCAAGRDAYYCTYQNTLAMNPRMPPSYLTCMTATSVNGGEQTPGAPGQCRLGPQKHGDGCSNSVECASNNCVKETKVCKGVAPYGSCDPSGPVDPCSPGYYCMKSASGSQCVPSVPLGSMCLSPSACATGAFCASVNGQSVCTAMFSVPTGSNTTIGPYMCATGNALVVSLGASSATNTYLCGEATEFAKLTTNAGSTTPLPCESYKPLSPGLACTCANDNQYRLTTIGGVGFGARTQTWSDLYACLQTSRGTTGDLCQYDAIDMERVRYGSCAYYACYPQYLKLATVTGARYLQPPLSYFDTSADCEKAAATAYFSNVASTPCIRLAGLETWLCYTGPRSLSVAATNGLLAFIFIVVWGGYLGHMWYFRKKHGIVFPCKKLNE